jgi:aromatic-L-amino-acid decarboxylase
MAAMDALNASGVAYLSHTKVNGRAALRMAIGGWQTTRADLDLTWQELGRRLSD